MEGGDEALRYSFYDSIIVTKSIRALYIIYIVVVIWDFSGWGKPIISTFGDFDFLPWTECADSPWQLPVLGIKITNGNTSPSHDIIWIMHVEGEIWCWEFTFNSLTTLSVLLTKHVLSKHWQQCMWVLEDFTWVTNEGVNSLDLES